ncbi:uncharacterized protein CDAR_513411 [Caerostris darwini]|uniref:Uncharacterized protein n=1 Tax=Caerostris darwini TaxID=1538125 RepID=A0AAV4WXT6_9ARAC|nr:uncharacterized protein CDAR_513411 [Caerostris darwini]
MWDPTVAEKCVIRLARRGNINVQTAQSSSTGHHLLNLVTYCESSRSFIIMKIFFVFAITMALLVICKAGSSSMACSTGPDGQMRCVKNSSPDGSYAGASSYSNGQGGGMMAGAGQPDNMNYRYGNV